MSTTGSISIWFNFDFVQASENGTVVLEFGDEDSDIWFEVGQDSSGKLEIRNRVSGTYQWGVSTDVGSVTANTWHNLIITHDGTEPSIWVDGVSSENWFYTNDLTVWIHPDIDSVRIGVEYHNTSNPSMWMNGQVDDMAFWTDVLTNSEIASLQTTEADQLADTSNLVVYYDFEQTGSTLTNHITAPLSALDGTWGSGEEPTAGVTGISGFAYDFGGNGANPSTGGDNVEIPSKFAMLYAPIHLME